MAKAQREKQKMKNVILKTRRDVASELIRSLPGGCKFASDLLGGVLIQASHMTADTRDNIDW